MRDPGRHRRRPGLAPADRAARCRWSTSSRSPRSSWSERSGRSASRSWWSSRSCSGAGAGFFFPAYSAILPRILPAGQLLAANGLEGAIRPALQQAAGPAAAGMLLGRADPGPRGDRDRDRARCRVRDPAVPAPRAAQPATADAERSARQPDHSAKSVFHDLREAVVFTVRTPWLLWTLLYATLWVLVVVGPEEVLLPFLIRERIGEDPRLFGFLLAVYGAGGVLGSIVVSSRKLPRRYLTTMNLVWGVSTLPFIIVGFTDQYWLLLASLFIVGFGFSYGNVIWGTLLQRRVPRHMLGRDLEPGLLRLARAHAAVDGARGAAVRGAVAAGDLHRGGRPHARCSASSRSSPRACRRMRSPIPWETETVPAHPAAVLGTRPRVSWGSSPHCWCASRRPRSSSCASRGSGGLLLAAGMLVAWLVRCTNGCRGRGRARVAPGAAAECADVRTPSLLRDLSLIALGLLIVSSIPLAAELDNLAFVRFALALGRRGRRAVRRVAVRVPRPRDPLPLARRRPLDRVPVDLAGRRARASAG